MKSFFKSFVFFLFFFAFLHSEEIQLEMSLFNESLDLDPVEMAVHGKKKDPLEYGLMDINLSADCEPLTTAAGCVNLISGHFFQANQDLVSNTIDPLVLTRYYDSGSLMESFLGFGFGCQHPLFISEAQKNTKHSYAMVSERDGFLVPYRTLDPENLKGRFIVDPRLFQKGYTNFNQDKISGQTNPINSRAKYEANKGWKISLGNGSKRLYQRKMALSEEGQRQIGFPSQEMYLLTEEVKPNGNTVYFDYDSSSGKPLLSHVWTVSRSNKALLNSVKFHYSPDGCLLLSSCGHSVSYLQKPSLFVSPVAERPKMQRILQGVHSSQKGELGYGSEYKNKPVITRVNKPRDHFLTIEYDNKGRVKTLGEPLGEQGESILTFKFDYFDNLTQVRNALNQLTHYHFDSKGRLSHTVYYDQDKPLRQETFEWNEGERKEGWLKSKSIGLGKALFYLKTYTYDSHGNVFRETIHGNITGEKPQTFSLDQKDQMDHQSIRYTYTKDGRHLPTSKTTPEGVVIHYDYLLETNLCTKELHSYQGKIQERKFQSFDDNGQVCLIIEDDGSGKNLEELIDITVRKETWIQTETTPNRPSFGKPNQRTERILDRSTGQMIFLKQIRYLYDEKGNEICQQFYNSKQELCFAKAKTYDSRQRVIIENNPLGHLTYYTYDDSNNKTEEKLVGPDQTPCYTICYTYDSGNRLIRKEEHHRSGKVFITSYTYNGLNQLIAETDRYGNTTRYTYNRFGKQTECFLPPMQDASGQVIHPKTEKKYNSLNQPIVETDERGYSTHYTYNIYGHPTQITYPDQTIERFVYYPSGLLKQKWHADGTSLCFVYDPKGRLIKEQTLDAQGFVLKEEEFIYKGNLLQSKKDAMGVVTTFHYDGAGRKVVEIIGNHDKDTVYAYDDFDRIIHIKHQNSQIERYEYDWLDRMITKTLEDTQGKVYSKEEYAYDIQGNQIQKTIWQSDNQVAHYKSCFDSDGTRLWQENPLQHKTTWEHQHFLLNEIYQTVHTCIITDALGRPTAEVEDVFHRLVKKDSFENGKCLSKNRYAYDAAGNLVQQLTTVMADGEPLRDYTIQTTYDSRNRRIAETEWPAGKTTHYSYDARGRLSTKTKPDGVILHYAYDALGRLQALDSSDNTILYSYTYDLHDNPLEVQDHNHQTKLNRSYDLFNRLTKEEVSPGVVTYYHYDSLDRLTQLTLPDGSTLHYHNDAYHLKKLERYSTLGQLIYQYEIPAYDKAGRPLCQISPAGQINCAYDLLGRAIHIQTPQWESKQERFDPTGNLLALTQKDPSGTTEESFTYDRFNHLTQEKLKGNRYHYDSLGNCISHQDQPCQINALNQLEADGQGQYTYDANGNVTSQTNPQTVYLYDALNRLTCCIKEGSPTYFFYDAFDRCLQISDSKGVKTLLYQAEKEIGSWKNGRLKEFRAVHPSASREQTFAIELDQQLYFPLQDHGYSICALQNPDGTLAQWTRYSSFGDKTQNGSSTVNPWGFANRREVAGLLLFTHRFYNPQMRRWLTTDPIGFEDSLNLYQYVHNNPHRYHDPDGQAVIVVPIIQFTFGAALGPIILPTLAVVAGATLAYGVYHGLGKLDVYMNQVGAQDVDEKVKEQTGIKDDKSGGKRKRFKPDPNADGEHSTFRKDPDTGEITHYETFKPQTNPRNPNPWETEKRYDGKGDEHFNTKTGKDIFPPHIHDSKCPGGIRPAEPFEIPNLGK